VRNSLYLRRTSSWLVRNFSHPARCCGAPCPEHGHIREDKDDGSWQPSYDDRSALLRHVGVLKSPNLYEALSSTQRIAQRQFNSISDYNGVQKFDGDLDTVLAENVVTGVLINLPQDVEAGHAIQTIFGIIHEAWSFEKRLQFCTLFRQANSFRKTLRAKTRPPVCTPRD